MSETRDLLIQIVLYIFLQIPLLIFTDSHTSLIYESVIKFIFYQIWLGALLFLLYTMKLNIIEQVKK